MPLHRERRATQKSVKSGPPLRGRPEKPAGGRRKSCTGETTPRCASFLPGGLLRAITVCKLGRIRV